VNMLAGCLVLALVAVQMANRALRLLRAGEVSETLHFPCPFLIFVAAAGLALLACAFLTDAVYLVNHRDPDTEALAEERRQGVVSVIHGELEIPEKEA